MATQKKKTLEEFLFQKPREEYVTAPEPFTVEKRKDGKIESKSKVAKMVYDPETKNAQIDNAPLEVSGELKEEAQAPRPLKERVLPQEPVGEPPAPATKYTPPVEAPVKEEKLPEASGPSAWERFLVGATPALVGLLSGNELEGIQLSGQTLANTEADLYKRNNDFNSKLAELKAKRAISGSTSKKPNYARQELYDPKSKQTYVHSIVDGQDAGALGIAPPKTKSGKAWTKTELYNPETKQTEVAFVNPETDEVQFYGKGKDAQGKRVLADLDFQGEPTKAVVDLDQAKVVDYLGKVATKTSPYASLEEGRQKRFADQKTLTAFEKFSNGNSKYNKMLENLEGLNMAAQQLNLGNPRANAGLQNYLARNVYGEKGPLSDQDISRLAGDPSYGALIERFLDARLNGQLGSMDRQDIRQILDLAYKVQVEKIMQEAQNFGEGYKALGYDPTPGIQAYIKGRVKPLDPFRPGDITRKPMDSDRVLMERDGVKKYVEKSRVKEMEKLGAKVVK